MTAGMLRDVCCAGNKVRADVRGKFLFTGDVKLRICGVTYGTFRTDQSGSEFNPATAVSDFREMVASGINAVRTYTVPPIWFLDLAAEHGLLVMVGIPWEQHITFLDDRKRRRSIEDVVRSAARSAAGHPAVLCYAVGNEIPSSIVRWYGAGRIERFLARLAGIVKTEDPGALVTYVNFPTTEYLSLPFLDLVCFNVYLESREPWERYLARLQNLAGERPLLLAEIGLDSRRNSEAKQAHSLNWLVRSANMAGCAGTFVFAWTDEWHRGGLEVNDWDFGLTRRDRSHKPALASLRKVYSEPLLSAAQDWPRISVVVCTHNGHRTIPDTLQGLRGLQYSNFEVIIVDDGSSPSMEPVVSRYGFRTIRTANQGLSAARNLGFETATGEIVAYIDDDAYPDPDWLSYLAIAFRKSNHAGIGGPNLAPPGDGPIADCVANAPGGPTHILLSDEVAEHIPGCNMAFRKTALEAVGGFDPRFRAAGDDVDLCWALERLGGTLGFHAGAVVWHHRRNSLRAFWKQQQGYGHAESLLTRKWPEKYNAAGHMSWVGRIYGRGLLYGLGQLTRIYQGTWGGAPFQSLYQTGQGVVFSLLLMPEWYLIVLVLGTFAWLGRGRLWVALPLFALAVLMPLIQAWIGAHRATFPAPRRSSFTRVRTFGLRLLTAVLHLMQPVARLSGRIRHGLSPWRTHVNGFCIPVAKRYEIWNEQWREPAQWLRLVEEEIRSLGAVASRGGDFDAWDLEVRGGLLGSCRILMGIEEHGYGRQLVRFRTWPRTDRFLVILLLILVAGALDCARARDIDAFAFLAVSAAVLAAQIVQHCGAAMMAAHTTFSKFTIHNLLGSARTPIEASQNGSLQLLTLSFSTPKAEQTAARSGEN